MNLMFEFRDREKLLSDRVLPARLFHIVKLAFAGWVVSQSALLLANWETASARIPGDIAFMILVLAWAEVAGGVLFVIPRTYRLGAALLLLIYGMAMVVHVAYRLPWSPFPYAICALALFVSLRPVHDRCDIARKKCMKIEPPVRVKRTYTQKLCAPPDRVFPLLCPVREAEWVDSWDPEVVYSDSGIAEPDCVFIIRNEETRTIWTVSRYEPENGIIEMIHVTPGVTVCCLRIKLAANDTGGTDAEVTYQHTAIGPTGRKFVAGFTDGYYADFMRRWEDDLNAFLQKPHRPAR